MRDGGLRSACSLFPLSVCRWLSSCVCVVVSAGCAVYSVRPFGVCVSYGRAVSAAWGLVELRYESSLLAVCGSGLSSSLSPRTVQLLDARTVRVMSELSFAGGVLDVRLTGERLVCVLTDKVHVFDLRSLRQLYSLSATLTARGACAVVPFEQPPTSTSTAFIAVPSHSTRGDANVYSYDGQLLAAVHAHSSAIRMLALSGDGRLMATCSLSGTLIRLFSLPNGTKLLTLRRGTLSSHVTCLAFNRAGESTVRGQQRQHDCPHLQPTRPHAQPALGLLLSRSQRWQLACGFACPSVCRVSVFSLFSVRPLGGLCGAQPRRCSHIAEKWQRAAGRVIHWLSLLSARCDRRAAACGDAHGSSVYVCP